MSGFDTWTVVNTSPDAHTLGQWESVCTISNGYLGLRGRLAEQRGGAYPGTLIHGVFDELDVIGQLRLSGEQRPYLDPRYFDAAGRSPAVANLPDPLAVRVFVNESELSVGRGEISQFVQSLDLRTGVYCYRFDYRDSQDRTTRVEAERFACLRHAHRVFMRYTLVPRDHDAPIRIESGINGDVRSNLTGERVGHVTERCAWPPPRAWMTAHLPAREHEVRIGVHHTVRGRPPTEGPVGVTWHEAAAARYVFAPSRRGEPITLERAVVLTCSEDLRHGLRVDAGAELDAAVAQGFDAALAEQAAAWSELWARCDVRIDGDDPAQLGLRFCLYHLLAAAPRFSDRLSVPVKLLTGELYQGSVFYDTDLYIVPFYTFTRPELARKCLNYRWEGLRPGRETARTLGHAGAKLAWQAGPVGEECLGRWWRSTHTNVHVNADAVYALVQYDRATDDAAFMAERGIDLLVETARFFAARAIGGPGSEAYDLVGVTGPDEGHFGVSTNFFTNVLAARNLRWAAEALARLADRDRAAHAATVRRLGLRDDEPDHWCDVAQRLRCHPEASSGLIEQCAGFFRLPRLPTELAEKRKTGFVDVGPYQAMLQPDVLMALALLRDDFEPRVYRTNWHYYKDKSLNYSSVSFAALALAAAEAGDLEEAYRHFVITTGMDLDESLTGRRDTLLGLHGTAAGGAWLAAVAGFGGLGVSDTGIRIRPRLPARWDHLRFNVVLRGMEIAVEAGRDQVVVRAGAGPRVEVPLTLAGQVRLVRSGETLAVDYEA